MKRSSIVTGALLGIVGFFVVPVVGLVICFAAGVSTAESRSASAAQGLALSPEGAEVHRSSILIELAGVLVAAGSWLTAVLAH